MLKQASWIHGNSVVVEQSENLRSVQYHGWGTDMFFIPGKNSWCHISIPTPVIMNDQRAKVQKLFLLFECKQGEGNIRNIHIWDSAFQVQNFEVSLNGAHRSGLDNANVITLTNPHEVVFGMSISFFFQAAIGFDTQIPPPLLRIAGAGADFF